MPCAIQAVWISDERRNQPGRSIADNHLIGQYL
jgi:hypothetical protein